MRKSDGRFSGGITTADGYLVRDGYIELFRDNLRGSGDAAA